MREVIVIGAGASGMISAIEASKRAKTVGKDVHITILEHNNVAGRKIQATGNGRCNLTNRQLDIKCFRSHDMSKVEDYLGNYNAEQVIDYFKDMGMLCTDKNGYIYPYSLQASTVNEILVNQLKKYNVSVIYDCHVLDITKENEVFFIKASEGYIDDSGVRKKKRSIYKADKVIVACGSKAYSKLGSDGSGYNILKNLGLKIIPVVPALTGLKCRENVFSLSAGVRTQAHIKLFVDHEYIASDCGEIQLTEYGISGIPVFQISRYASYGIYDGCKVHANIDFMPEYSKEQIMEIICHNINEADEMSIYSVLSGIINSKLATMLLKYCRINPDIHANIIENSDILEIISAIKEFYTVIVGNNDFEQAQICAGGIKLTEIDENFQANSIKGLYITGEVLDVDGKCGGYNLHWAWISGITAGRAVVVH